MKNLALHGYKCVEIHWIRIRVSLFLRNIVVLNFRQWHMLFHMDSLSKNFNINYVLFCIFKLEDRVKVFDDHRVVFCFAF